MAGGPHWIFLLQKWLGLRSVIDVRSPDIDAVQTYTDLVKFSREPSLTTDVTLDDMTVWATDPPSDCVVISSGTAHWYGYRLIIEQPITSPPIDVYYQVDCDPVVGGSMRYALLCLYRDLMGDIQFLWVYSDNEGYPRVPHNVIPLCYVRQMMGDNIIKSSDIENWRTIHPANAPSTNYLYPPVWDAHELDNHTNVPDGAVSFVLNEGTWYFYANGIWAPQRMGTFDNTYYVVDVEEDTVKTRLPWAIYQYVELVVFRDGFFMAPGKDYTINFGPGSEILWNQIIYKNMRIVAIRNPFLGASHSDDMQIDNYERINIYVDGEVGLDSFPGTIDAPFKTLQRAFNCIPISSKNEYQIFAQKLKYGDAFISDKYNARVWGVIDNRRVRLLRLILADDCEWIESLMNHVYIAENVYTFDYSGVTIPYSINHKNCLTRMYYTTIYSSVYAAGGQLYIEQSTSEKGTVFCNSNNITRIIESNICYLAFDTNAYVHCVHSNFRNIIGVQHGLLALEYCDVSQENFKELVADTMNILGGMSFENCDVRITFSTWARDIKGYDTHLILSYCTISGGTNPVDYRMPPLHLRGNSELHWEGNVFERMKVGAVIIEHGSNAHFSGGRIDRVQVGNGIDILNNSTITTSSWLTITNINGHGIFLDGNSSGKVQQTNGSFIVEWGIRARRHSFCVIDSSAPITGDIGQYLADSCGGHTVIVDGQDEHPHNLSMKLRAGTGLIAEIESDPTMSNLRFMRMGIDVAALLDPTSDLSKAFNLRPRAFVFKYLYDIVAGQAIDVTYDFPGEGFLSSVARRVSNPVTQVKLQSLATLSAGYFVQQDAAVGTEFLANGWQLRNRPILGYPTNSLYFMYSLVTLAASLPLYAIGTLTKLTINYTQPGGTLVRCGISINGGKNFKRWNGAEWVNCIGESVLPQINSADPADVVNMYPIYAWQELKAKFNPMYVDVGFGIMSVDRDITPVVHSFSWSYIEDGYHLDISEKFEKQFYPTRAVFTNISGATIQPPTYFTVYPLLDYYSGT